MRAVVFAAIVWAGLAPAAPASLADPYAEALSAAARLQDTARVLRNGLRTGAPISVLDHLLQQLARDLDRLDTAHAQWAPSVPDQARATVATEQDAIRRGCLRLHEHLDEMALTLCGTPDDRARLAALAIDIARQARSCERSTRAVQQKVRAFSS
jgi:hypothetical protein